MIVPRAANARPALLAVALGATSVAVLSGCATPAPPDTTPLVRAATIVSDVKNGGVKGQFASAGTRTETILGGARRVDDASKFTGSIMGRFGGKRDVTEILRTDRNVLWRLDNRKKTYLECPLAGCPTYLDRLDFADATYEEDAELEECSVELVESELSMEPTGERREIAGFDAREYLFTWRSVHADPAGARMRNELSSRVWTSEPAGETAEAIAMEAAFDAGYRDALGQTYPRNLVLAFPREALEVLQKYLIETLPESEARRLYARIGALAPIEGFPVSRAVSWQANGGTCATPQEPERDDENDLDTGSIGGLFASVGKQILRQEVEKKREQKAREIALEPMFSYVETVESVTIEDVRESRLSVPANYELVDRR